MTPRVTLVSNINHSIYAARAIARLGVLDRYLGPVIVDADRRWPNLVTPRLRATRSFIGVDDLPLNRLLLAELTARAGRALPLTRTRSARLNSQVLDSSVRRRLGRPDVVHLNTAGLVNSVRRAKQCGALVVADHREVHPRDHTGEDPLVGRLEAELAAADWVLANSERSARSLIEGGVPAERVVTLPLGVDVDRFTPGPGMPRSEDAPPRLLFVGAMIPAKGVDHLLEVLGDPGLAGATLRLCGHGGDPALVARARATAGVEVLGAVDRERLAQEYRDADLLVLPSLNDAFGLVAVEALACGTPVVVTTACGVAPLIPDTVGRVVPPGNVTALARAVHELLALSRDPQTSVRARQVALELSWDAYECRLGDFYRETVLPAVSAKESLSHAG